MKRGPLCGLVAAIALAVPVQLSAHVFAQPYTLPVPLWIYLYACIATLVVSFALVAYFTGTTVLGPIDHARDVVVGGYGGLGQWIVNAGRVVAFACLTLTVTAGLVGTPDPAANISMTLFWVVFLLGLTYLTALVGDLYSVVNPWLAGVRALEAAGLNLSTARVRYPGWAGYWPALGCHMALVWIELFVLPKPAVLAEALLAYSALIIVGSFLFGRDVWFEYGDLFGIFFRIIGSLAPIEYRPAADGRSWAIRVRWPFLGALRESPPHLSFVLVVLFMLSSTTYDAVHETYFWVNLYWQRLVPILQTLWPGPGLLSTDALIAGYVSYQRVGLILSPFGYLAAYLLALGAARLMTGTSVSVRRMTYAFAFPLVPIALVYHATHYYTILASNMSALPHLATDPFGWGWHLLGTFEVRPETPFNMGAIWHTQVGLMLGGHIAAVYLSHLAAVRLFSSGARSVRSQLPMLLLMVGYTCLGLWVLSLPLAVPQVLPLG